MTHIINNKTLLVKSPVNDMLIYVTGIFTTHKQVNNYLKSKQGVGQGVISIFGKFIFTAKNSDLGGQP